MQEIHFYKGIIEPISAENGSIWFDKNKKTIKVKDTTWEEYGGDIDTNIPESPTDTAAPSTKLFKTELDKKQDNLWLIPIGRNNIILDSYKGPESNSTLADSESTAGNVILGRQNSVTGNRNFVPGCNNTSTGNLSYIGGANNISSANLNFIHGVNNQALKINSIVFGQRHIANGNLSFCSGYYNTTQGDFSVALGSSCSALGSTSVAIGGAWGADIYLSGEANSIIYTYNLEEDCSEEIIVVGNLLHDSSYNTYIIQEVDSINKTITLDKTLNATESVTNEYARINGTIAEGNYSIAHRGIAKGYSSISMGRGNNSMGTASQAFGQFTIANNDYEFATGNYNKSNTGDVHTVFSIGNGTSKSDRKNLVEVSSDGSVYYDGIGNYDGTNPASSSSIQQEINNLKSQVGTLEWTTWN